MAMEDTTYLAMAPTSIVLDSVPPQQQLFLNAFCRKTLAEALQWFRNEQARIANLRKDRADGPQDTDAIPERPDLNASPEEHAEWHANYGSQLGITVAHYAREVRLARSTLYNERFNKGLTRPKNSSKKRKPKVN